MRHRFPFLMLFASIAYFPLFSAPVRIHGVAVQYAGMNLVLETYNNFISNRTRPIGILQVDSKGHFEGEVEVEEVTQVFLELGRYRAHLFVEPNGDYQVVLPDYEARPDADRFNPFYQSENILLGIANQPAKNLNQALSRLDDEYEYLYNKNAIDLVRRQYIRLADQMMVSLDSLNNAIDHPFYRDYLHFRKAIFFALPRNRQMSFITRSFFSNSPVLYNNPAYWDAFRSIYSGFLDGYIRSGKGKSFASVFQSTNRFDSICGALTSDSLFCNVPFGEVMLLKHLYDGYYSGKVSGDKASLVIGDAVQTASSPQIRSIAVDLLARINHLKIGSQAPSFQLKNLKGKEVELSDFKGKFVYLAFLHTKNYACIKDLPALEALSNRYKKNLVVVGIVTNENMEEAEAYFKNNPVSWPILPFTSGQRIVFDYNISVLPAYYLINPEGKMALSPAPNPGDNFSKVFNDIFQTYSNQQIRKERPKEKNIYDLSR